MDFPVNQQAGDEGNQTWLISGPNLYAFGLLPLLLQRIRKEEVQVKILWDNFWQQLSQTLSQVNYW